MIQNYAGGGPTKLKGGLSQLGKMFEKATSPVKNVDPLAYAVALRQASQLEKAGEMLGIKPGALTQLAADPKALNAAILAQAEANVGPANPSRRKFIKQVGSTAAQQVIPGRGVGSRLARELMKLPENVPEGVSFTTKELKKVLKETGMAYGWFDEAEQDPLMFFDSVTEPFRNFMSQSGLRIVGNRVHFDPKKLNLINTEVSKIFDEYDNGLAEGADSLWKKYGLDNYEDAEYSGSSVQGGVDLLEAALKRQLDPEGYRRQYVPFSNSTIAEKQMLEAQNRLDKRTDSNTPVPQTSAPAAKPHPWAKTYPDFTPEPPITNEAGNWAVKLPTGGYTTFGPTQNKSALVYYKWLKDIFQRGGE